MASNIRDLLLDLNKVRFSSLDFHTHADDLYAQLQVKFAADFNDFQASSLAIMFLDLVAFGLDTLSFYLDRRASDNFLVTARTAKSVSKLARQLGYKIKGAVPASVDLTVSLTTSQLFPVTIPKGFKFKTSSGIIFETAQATTYAVGDDVEDTQIIPCYQGETVSETFESSGLENQVFELSRTPTGQFVSNNSVQVFVNGSEYTENDFLTYDETDQFEVSYLDFPATLRFGDGIAGTIPPENATIQVTYINTLGKLGLVPVGAINAVNSNLVVGTTVINLTITNLESSSGGDDAEAINKVKKSAGRLFKARNVAITESDYESISSSYADSVFGRVAVAKAISSRTAATDIELQNLIFDINQFASENIPAIQTIVTDITTDLDTILDSITIIDTEQQSAEARLLTLDSNLQSILNSVRSIKNTNQELSIDVTTMTTNVATLLTSVTAITVSISDTLTSTTKNSLLDILYTINSTLASMSTHTNNMSSYSNDAINSVNTTIDLADDLNTNNTAIGTNVDVIIPLIGTSTPSTGLYTKVESINTTLQDNSNEIASSLTQISQHIDSFLSADCSANLVSVPILSYDNEGFYTSPSTGLIRSLQDYLDTRKEVTQIVQVASGELYLIPAVLNIRIGILPGYSDSVIKAAAQAVIDNILKNRDFGESLYVSEFSCVLDEIPGIAFNNVVIAGHLLNSVTSATKLDASGNLIIESIEIITKGYVTINIE